MTEKDILQILSAVKHPGKGDKDIVSLGMVNSVNIDGNKVTVTLGFPKRRDPLTEYLVGSTRATLYRELPQGTMNEVKTIVVDEAPAKKKNTLDPLRQAEQR